MKIYDVEINVKISLWTAIKIRIAGIKNLDKDLKKQLKDD